MPVSAVELGVLGSSPPRRGLHRPGFGPLGIWACAAGIPARRAGPRGVRLVGELGMRGGGPALFR